jgi:hypothetical protein
MADRAASLRIARLRVRASSAEAARAIATQFDGALSPVSASSVPGAQRVTLQASGESAGRSAAQALGAYLSGGRDG